MTISFRRLGGRLMARFKDHVEYEGVVLPAPAIRFGGDHFRENADYLASAVAEARRLEEHCGLSSSSRLLEIGCGPGRLAIGLLRHLGGVAQYQGVDVHRRSIAWCQRHIAGNHPEFRFLHLDMANPRYNRRSRQRGPLRLPFPDGAFDMAYMYSVFSHLQEPDVRMYMSEFRRLLRPRGHVFLTAFVEDGVPRETVNPGDYVREWRGALHCVRFERSFLMQLFAEYGFELADFAYHTETDQQSAIYLVSRN